MNANFQQQQVTGKVQTVIIDPSSTAETDENYVQFAVPGPPIEPEEKDVEEKETDGDEDPGLNHDEDDDLSLNIEEDEPQR